MIFLAYNPLLYSVYKNSVNKHTSAAGLELQYYYNLLEIKRVPFLCCRDFAGPTLGGYLTEKFGFERCVTYVAYACGALVTNNLFFFIGMIFTLI